MADRVSVLPDDVYNEALVANAHPVDWVNPEPAPRYNLVVIGAGTAGLVTAAGAAGLGARVALIEKHLLGGDCLNAGCVPSKAVLRAARAAADVRDAGAFGIRVAEAVTVDFAAVMERMRRLRAQISANDSARRFRSLGVDVFLGAGRFSIADSVEVTGKTLRFKKAVIATGTRPAVPSIPGLVATGYQTNETIFSLTALPERLAVIGAGPVGCELAQAFARFGARVTLIANKPQILEKEDRDAVERVQQVFLREGIKILLESRIESAEIHGADKVLRIKRAGAGEDLRVDEILVAVGRQPNVEGLNLETAGVAYDTRKGVHVNDYLQTTTKRIFAAGDICSAYKFTHAADAQARIVIRNALFLGRARASALTIPWCTYTEPEIAHVGISEGEAKKRGIELQTFVQDLQEVDRAILDGETNGFAKIHVRKGSDRILGGTIVANHAGDMIAEVTLALVSGQGLGVLSRTIHPYPTQAEALKKLGDAYYRTRLKPFVKTLSQKWLAWTR
ncbi:MAG TPA: mercuric reductase [Gemmataceae bacterium]|nr:mercuric reductase [Gemmataceae bacterium]